MDYPADRKRFCLCFSVPFGFEGKIIRESEGPLGLLFLCGEVHAQGVLGGCSKHG